MAKAPKKAAKKPAKKKWQSPIEKKIQKNLKSWGAGVIKRQMNKGKKKTKKK